MHCYLVSPVELGGSDQFELTYSSKEELSPGALVKVPLLRRSSLGIVTSNVPKPEFKTKPIAETLTTFSPLPTTLIDLARWLAEYYLASPKAIWQTLLPAGLTKQRRAANPAQKYPLSGVEGFNLILSDEQRHAIDQAASRPGPFLLHGVTGSGKTQVYIELARQTLAAGRSVIILVPEIALSPQIIARFQADLGNVVIARHSRMTGAAKHAAWQRALESRDPVVVIGPRSSLFLPVRNLGLIVIDEAHETSYKQEQAPRYQTDMVAAKLARLHQAKLILGSATPSLTQIFLAQQQRLATIELKQRANRIPPPQAQIIDLRDKENSTKHQLFSNVLIDELRATINDQRQSLLFLNRRGSASSHLCGDCGTVSQCPNCHIPLTFHADQVKLVCHYCNFRALPPATCANCHSTNLRFIGSGTKLIEAEVAKLFPQARLARLDKDSATDKYLHEVYEGLHKGDIDILIGTQMVAKGLDLPNVDLVGVVSADTMLSIPDYTASERTYQLISQVSGRCGRGDRPGQVLIQTHNPGHPAIVAAAKGDFARFSAAELEQRRLLNYPPYVYIMKLTIRRASQEAAQHAATKLAADLQVKCQLSNVKCEVVGPAPSFHERIGGQYDWQLIVKSKHRAALVQAAHQVPKDWTIDLDPINLL